MAQNNQPIPTLRATTVARVNQLLKTGLTKAGAFEKISAETGRAKDAVQMLYYRAMRAAKAAAKAPGAPVAQAVVKKPASRNRPSRSRTARPAVARPAVAVAPKPAVVAAPAAPVAAAAPKRPSRSSRRSRSSRPSRSASKSVPARPQGVAQSGDFPGLLNGIATAINALLKHVEKTVEENKTLKQQADRLKAITSLIRGR